MVTATHPAGPRPQPSPATSEAARVQPPTSTETHVTNAAFPLGISQVIGPLSQSLAANPKTGPLKRLASEPPPIPPQRPIQLASLSDTAVVPPRPTARPQVVAPPQPQAPSLRTWLYWLSIVSAFVMLTYLGTDAVFGLIGIEMFPEPPPPPENLIQVN